MKIQPTKVLSGMRITLPKDFVDQNQIKEGEFVGIFSPSDAVIKIVPIEVAEK